MLHVQAGERNDDCCDDCLLLMMRIATAASMITVVILITVRLISIERKMFYLKQSSISER